VILVRIETKPKTSRACMRPAAIFVTARRGMTSTRPRCPRVGMGRPAVAPGGLQIDMAKGVVRRHGPVKSRADHHGGQAQPQVMLGRSRDVPAGTAVFRQR